jgi:hypothetical protein
VIKRPVSQWLSLAGLVILTLTVVSRMTVSGWLLVAALPLLTLIITGVRPPARWGGWVAVAMIPYVCIGVMDLLITRDGRWQAALLAVSAVLVFFLALDSVRRTGASLRR